MGDYQRDTGALSIAEHGAYFLMLQYHYATEKPLPTGKDLYRLLRCESKADRCAVDAVARQFWTEADGGLVNNRAQQEIAGTHAYAEAQSQRANKRWNKPTDMPVHMPTHVQVQSPVDASHSHSQIKTRAGRGSRLTLTEIPEDWRAFCRQERPELSPEAVFAKFRDYWIGAPKGTKLDWMATWRNWVREERGAGKPQSSTSKTASALMSLEGMKNATPRIQLSDSERPAEIAGFIPAKHASV